MDDTTTIDEIADGIYRISTFVPEISPVGFTFNQFLIQAEEPLLFHTGLRAMFPAMSEAVATVLPVESVRWLTFGHVEADECGSINSWLAAAPRSEVAQGFIGSLYVGDMVDRPCRVLADDEVLDLGGKRVRHLDTPHVPHSWDARALYEETTGTLLCGDLFTHIGRGPALITDDVVEPAIAAEDMFLATSLTPATGSTIRRMAELAPTTLAIMHGSSFNGDCTAALGSLADAYDARLSDATAGV
jgi:flavorubredoxin